MLTDEFITVDWSPKNEVAFFNSHSLLKTLRDTYFILADPVGTPTISRKQNKILSHPFVLSKYDAFYLHSLRKLLINANEKDFLDSYDQEQDNFKYKIFLDLKSQNLFVISSTTKFGCDFLAYKGDTNFFHATYLINCYEEEDKISTKTIIQSERTSINSKKQLIFAFYSKAKNQITYTRLGWEQLDKRN